MKICHVQLGRDMLFYISSYVLVSTLISPAGHFMIVKKTVDYSTISHHFGFLYSSDVPT